jgi:hypothetical protein
MNRLRQLTIVAATVGLIGAVGPAHGATPAQTRARCASEWSGSTAGAAYRAYAPRCAAAGVAAVDAATDAGNPTNPRANRARAIQACGKQFPPPRRTAARVKAFQTCIVAAISSQVAFAGRPLVATLNGANEVPPAGAGSGTALIRLNQGRNRVCYTITVTGVASPVTVAHIHQGAAGIAGPPIVSFSNLQPLSSGKAATGCEEGVPGETIKAIRQRPDQYYVNVHTEQYPGGAIRGQLRKK